MGHGADPYPKPGIDSAAEQQILPEAGHCLPCPSLEKGRRGRRGQLAVLGRIAVTVSQIDVEHGAIPVAGPGDAALLYGAVHSPPQFFRSLVGQALGLAGGDDLETRNASGDRDGISVECPRVGHTMVAVPLGVIGVLDYVQQVCFPSDAAAGHGPHQDLGHGAQVRLDTYGLLPAAWGPAKATYHLVYDKDRAVLGAQVTGGVGVFSRGGDGPHVRSRALDYQGGDITARQGVLQCRNVVGGQGYYAIVKPGRETGGGLVEGRIDPNEYGIGPAVEVALQLHYLWTIGVGPGEAEGHHVGLGARAGVS